MPLIGAFIVPHPPLILPEIGRGEERKIQKTIDSYQEVARRIAVLRPDTLLVTSPHSVTYADYLHVSPGIHAEGSFKDFQAPQVKLAVDYDRDLAEAIASIAKSEGIPAGTLGERNKALDHGTMVPLFFVNQQFREYRVVRISISGLSPLDHYHFGQCIAQAVRESPERVVLIASGDLSHKLKADGPYGFALEGPAFDRQVTEGMATGDFLRFLTFDEEFCESAGECGLRSFQILAGVFDGKQVRSELLSYEGPFGVGYAVAAFESLGEDENRQFGNLYEKTEKQRLAAVKAEEDPFVHLARQSLETYVKTSKRLPLPSGLPADMTGKKAGVFVSLKLDGRLRGCIGTIQPVTACIAQEILRNAVSSGVEDPRFSPVRADELPRLVYSVDVLGDAEPIASLQELDVLRYGVIVRLRGRCGLLLPNLEGVNTPQEQVEIALRKAGITAGESYLMERFEVVRHK